MKLESRREVEEVVVYTMSYSKFNNDNIQRETWESAIWYLLSTKATYSSSIKSLEVLQTGKQPNGLYENFIKMVVPSKSDFDWDSYLTDIGYGFNKEKTKLYTFVIDCEEARLDYDCEVVIEVE